MRYYKPMLVGGYLICPRCHQIVVCNCNACRDLRKQFNITGFKEEIYKNNPHIGELLICPYCGYVNLMDAWEDYIYKQDIVCHMEDRKCL